VKSPDPLTLSPATATGYLYPGTVPADPWASADVAVEISNPNDFSVNVPSLVLDTGEGTGGFDVDGSNPGCNLSALSFTTQDAGGSGWMVPANASNWPLDLADAIHLAPSAASACQGRTFKVYLAVGS
jgi:hypothetical protein